MKLLIVEDHAIVIAGCRTLFVDDPDVEFYAARSLAEGRARYAACNPDVVVVDVNLPDGSGLDMARDLCSKGAKVIVFTMSDAPILAMIAIEFGAYGYVSKSGDPEELRSAICAAARGERWIPPVLTQEVALLRVAHNRNLLLLTDRQIQILKFLVLGKSMAEIAYEIDACYKTVASECAAMRGKFNARTSSQMIRIATELKIV